MRFGTRRFVSTLAGAFVLAAVLFPSPVSATWYSETLIDQSSDQVAGPVIKARGEGELHLFYKQGSPGILYWNYECPSSGKWQTPRAISHDGGEPIGVGRPEVAFDASGNLYLAASKWITGSFAEDMEVLALHGVTWSQFASNPPDMIHATGRFQHAMSVGLSLGTAPSEEPWMDIVFTGHLRGSHANHDVFFTTNRDVGFSGDRASFETPLDITRKSCYDPGEQSAPYNLSDYNPMITEAGDGSLIVVGFRRNEGTGNPDPYSGIFAVTRNSSGAWGDVVDIDNETERNHNLTSRDLGWVTDDQGTGLDLGVLTQFHEKGSGDPTTLMFHVLEGSTWSQESSNLGSGAVGVLPRMDADSDGNAYVIWVSQDLHDLNLRTRDEDQSWSQTSTIKEITERNTTFQFIDVCWDEYEDELHVVYVFLDSNGYTLEHMWHEGGL